MREKPCENEFLQDSATRGNHPVAMVEMTIDPPRTPTPNIDWAAALAEHGKWLRTVVLARIGEPQAVDEVLQEVALAAVRNKAPLSDVRKLAPWLYQLAVRQTLLYRRKHGRARNLVNRYAERNQPREEDARSPDPLGWLLHGERKELIRVALDRLGRRDREILLLKYAEEWSYKDISTHLGISQSAVEARLHRARKRLRVELESLNITGTES